MSGAPVRDRACGGRPGTPPDREYTHMWEMPSGLPVDPTQLGSGRVERLRN